MLPSSRVEKALREVVFLKVDTDRYPAAANHFKAKALPTLIMIDHKGSLRSRHVGLLGPDELIKQLNMVERTAVE